MAGEKIFSKEKETTISVGVGTEGIVSMSRGGTLDLSHLKVGRQIHCLPSYISCSAGTVYVGLASSAGFTITSESWFPPDPPDYYQLVTFQSGSDTLYVTESGKFVVVPRI